MARPQSAHSLVHSYVIPPPNCNASAPNHPTDPPTKVACVRYYRNARHIFGTFGRRARRSRRARRRCVLAAVIIIIIETSSVAACLRGSSPSRMCVRHVCAVCSSCVRCVRVLRRRGRQRLIGVCCSTRVVRERARVAWILDKLMEIACFWSI